MARQGQSMSSSTYIYEIPKKEEDQFVEMIHDVERSTHVFSDGCGYISEWLMEKVAERFKVFKASAIQMRYSGFKGVLVTHPLLGKNGLPHIWFRKSMKKFEGKFNELSTIRISTFSPAYLNRQVILLLDYLGVPQQFFLDRNRKALENLDVKKTVRRLQKQTTALRELHKDEECSDMFRNLVKDMRLFFGPSRQFRRIFIRALLLSNNMIEEKHKDAEKTIYEVFSLDQEPIFEQILYNMVLGQGQVLKYKQRIRLHDAAVLIGVFDLQTSPKKVEAKEEQKEEDYSKMLKEGEVFCQVNTLSFALDSK